MRLLLLLPLLLWRLGAAEPGECSEAEIHAERIFGASPPVNYLLYALEPSLMAGLNFPVRAHEAPYLNGVADLPVIGGWFGQGRTPNMEMLAKVKPDLTIAWNYRGNFQRIAKALDALGLPSCSMALDRLEEYPGALRTLGRIAGREARGEALAADFEQRLGALDARAAGRRAQRPPRVYYAEGPGGLQTECSGSVHTELIERAGGENVHKCQATSGYGMEQISFEQLMLYNPEVIIVFDPNFYAKIFDDERFARLEAVQKGRVHRIPNAPINWFDRPPSFMRIAGLEWMHDVLWPDERPKEVLLDSLQAFFALYYRRTMMHGEIEALLNGGRP